MIDLPVQSLFRICEDSPFQPVLLRFLPATFLYTALGFVCRPTVASEIAYDHPYYLQDFGRGPTVASSATINCPLFAGYFPTTPLRCQQCGEEFCPLRESDPRISREPVVR
jgi:hypothetical protein